MPKANKSSFSSSTGDEDDYSVRPQYVIKRNRGSGDDLLSKFVGGYSDMALLQTQARRTKQGKTEKKMVIIPRKGTMKRVKSQLHCRKF